MDSSTVRFPLSSSQTKETRSAESFLPGITRRRIPGVFISGGGSSGGGCSANAIVKNGFVVAIILTNGGRGYTIPPTVTIVEMDQGQQHKQFWRQPRTVCSISSDCSGHGYDCSRWDGQRHSHPGQRPGYISLPSVQVGTITEAECEASGIETHAFHFSGSIGRLHKECGGSRPVVEGKKGS